LTFVIAADNEEALQHPNTSHNGKFCFLETATPIAATLSVSNPWPAGSPNIGNGGSIDDTQSFSLTPSHSSHPLTVTPDSEPPCSTPTSYQYQVPLTFTQPSGQYWSVDAGPDGCDVPDGKKPHNGGNPFE